MERSAALKKLEKLLGKQLGYRINAKAPSPEERAAARAAMPAAIEERNSLALQRDARQREILAADIEYQKLLIAARVARDDVDRLSATTRHYKITVGKSEGMFFVVKAEGDSWEQVIGKLTAEKAKA